MFDLGDTVVFNDTAGEAYKGQKGEIVGLPNESVPYYVVQIDTDPEAEHLLLASATEID